MTQYTREIEEYRRENPAELNKVFKEVTKATYDKLKPSDFDSLSTDVTEKVTDGDNLKDRVESTTQIVEDKTKNINESLFLTIS
jgi:hypothetical protein